MRAVCNLLQSACILVSTMVLGTIQMNSSIFLFLLLMIANPAFAITSSNSDEPSVCPKTRTSAPANATQENDATSNAPVAATAPAPIRNPRVITPRTVSPRWHSMLPGMFR